MSSAVSADPSPDGPRAGAGGHEQRLRALSEVAAAVAGAHELTDVLEVAAEATRGVLGVSSLSISRWELEHGRLRTLVNVGDLAVGEERWPTDETYAIADFPKAHAVLRRGEPHVTALDDPAADPAERRLLEELGKASCAAAPIVYEGETWGELYVANAVGAPRLTPADVQFLEAICSQLSLAVGRAELFSQLMRAAYRDALTGLANRRAFEEHLADALDRAEADGLALLLGDVDGLKELNDAAGHAAGDDALRSVGRVLGELGAGATAARIGGDEFCVIAERAGRETAKALVAELGRRLAAADPPVSLSWGVAVYGEAGLTAGDLLRVADTAQYEHKRTSRLPPAGPVDERRRHRGRGASSTDAARALTFLHDGLELLDAHRGAGVTDRTRALERLAAERFSGVRPAARVLAGDAIELLRREARR